MCRRKACICYILVPVRCLLIRQKSIISENQWWILGSVALDQFLCFSFCITKSESYWREVFFWTEDGCFEVSWINFRKQVALRWKNGTSQGSTLFCTSYFYSPSTLIKIASAFLICLDKRMVPWLWHSEYWRIMMLCVLLAYFHHRSKRERGKRLQRQLLGDDTCLLQVLCCNFV